MIEAPARDQMQNAPAAERLTFVLYWTTQPDLTAAVAALSRRERSAAAEAAYSAIKQEVVRQLECAGQVHVQDLPGTANAIVSATTVDWRRVAPLLEERRDVTVASNRIVAISP